ncbi:thermostable hemolysin [Inhella sp.]|uniref:thermostable hemolysin n=1 Tax=Inhella sp. TaxID=1921806 RepID=UPI0035B0363E
MLALSPTPAVMPLQLVPAEHPQRAEVEAFIRAIYAERFGARVQHFAPMLVAQFDAEGLAAAAGFRAAEHGPLFLERYLDAPVESLLQLPARRGIVEVGHLAARRAGEGRRLILQMGPLLAQQGVRWVVSTLTEELRHLFLRLGVAPLALGVADPQRLGVEAADWGDYYAHHPVVLAGSLDTALQVLARRRATALARAADGVQA